jgi:hypothetical protein
VDYVIRRFIASLAGLQCLRGWTFAETPHHAILQVDNRSPKGQSERILFWKVSLQEDSQPHPAWI